MPRGGNSVEIPYIDPSNFPQLMNTKQASVFLGVSESYLSTSRIKKESSPKLGKRTKPTPPPKPTYVNGKAYYTQESLKAWVAALDAH